MLRLVMEMDAAANLVAHTLRRFDLGAESVVHVTDVLAAMSRQSGMDLGQMEATFRRAARLDISLGDSPFAATQPWGSPCRGDGRVLPK